MIAIVYIIWGSYLVRAARNPFENELFLDFSVTANVAHISLMTFMAIYNDQDRIHLIGGILAAWLVLGPFTYVWTRAKKNHYQTLRRWQPWRPEKTISLMSWSKLLSVLTWVRGILMVGVLKGLAPSRRMRCQPLTREPYERLSSLLSYSSDLNGASGCIIFNVLNTRPFYMFMYQLSFEENNLSS